MFDKLVGLGGPNLRQGEEIVLVRSVRVSLRSRSSGTRTGLCSPGEIACRHLASSYQRVRGRGVDSSDGGRLPDRRGAFLFRAIDLGRQEEAVPVDEFGRVRIVDDVPRVTGYSFARSRIGPRRGPL